MTTKLNVWSVAKAISLYHYNVSAVQWARQMMIVLGPQHGWTEQYVQEKVGDYCQGFPHLFGTLDFERQQVHLRLIMDKYYDEAEHGYNANREFKS